MGIANPVLRFVISLGTVILCGQGCNKALAPTPPQQHAIQIARAAVASQDTWAQRAVYEADRDGADWLVTARRIEGYDASGTPQFVSGGVRFIRINKNGRVVYYLRGL